MDVTADIATRDCKEFACEEEAVDTRGRYAGLCSGHKAQRIAEVRALPSAPRPNGTLTAAAGALQKQARRVDRASKKLDDERAELRRVYLRFGVEAGFLSARA